MANNHISATPYGFPEGFSIIEVSDPPQIARSMTYWFPEIAQKWVLITDNEELLKIYQEMTS